MEKKELKHATAHVEYTGAEFEGRADGYEMLCWSNVNGDTVFDYLSHVADDAPDDWQEIATADEIMEDLEAEGLIEGAEVPSGESLRGGYDHHATDIYFVHEGNREALKERINERFGEIESELATL